MHARVLVVVLALAGCTGSPLPSDPLDEGVADEEPTAESWYLAGKRSADNQTLHYVLQPYPRSGPGGTAGPCCNLSLERQELDLGTFTGGPHRMLAAGTPFEFRLHYTCFQPALMTVRVTVLAAGEAAAEASSSKAYVGMFLPVHVEDVFRVPGTLERAIPQGGLAVSIQVEGCPLMSLGTTGDSASGIHFGVA